MTSDIVFYNGDILSVDEEFNIFSALAVKENKIVQVGCIDDVKPLISSNTITIDLQGRSVLPGFIDSHVHFTQTGLDEMALDAGIYTNLSDFYSAIEEYAKNTSGKEWIIVSSYNENKMGIDGLPDRWSLDELNVYNPIFISRLDAHSCCVNSKGFAKLNIGGDVDGVNRSHNDEYNGIFTAAANGLARRRLTEEFSDERRKQAVHLACQKALKAGITHVHAMEGGSLFNDRDVKVLKKEANNLPIGIKIYHQTMDVGEVLAEGFPRIGGCITLDGSIGSLTAAFEEPYCIPPYSRGNLYYTDEEVNNFVQFAHSKGLQIATHCIGDRAIEQMLRAYERCMGKTPIKNYRHRIEHFSIPKPEHIERAAALQLVISTQPAFDYYINDDSFTKKLGKDRIKRKTPLRSLLKKGILIAGGSDSPVTPMDPLLGIYSSVNHWNNEERLTVKEAIKLFTINGAKAVFEEERRGTLEEGKMADLVILGENPLSVDKQRIKDISVEMVVVGGEIKYEKSY